MDLGEKINPITKLQIKEIELRNGERISLKIPRTVYPPREDSFLLKEILENLESGGKAMEIGCGSGILSIILAKNGWSLESCDINPYAIAAAKNNSESASVHKRINFREGGLGDEGFTIPQNTKLIFWNLPYLNPPSSDEPRLEWIEEASMSDLGDKGWGHQLVDFLEKNQENLEPDLLIILLQRKHPISPSTTNYWIELGWSHRIIKSIWIYDEKIEIVAYWKPGQGTPILFFEECQSTMEEVKKLPNIGWQRVATNNQIEGRGRRDSIWISDKKDLTATWNIRKSILKSTKPGIIQIIVGTRIASLLQEYCKWPNDICDKNGKKIAGILIEMDNQDEYLRIGVGINHTRKNIPGVETQGWSEKMPETTKMNLLKKVDAALSTLFEEHKLLPSNLLSDKIEIESWRGISKLFSRGYSLKISNEKARVVGINDYGELITIYRGNEIIIEDLDNLNWLF